MEIVMKKAALIVAALLALSYPLSAQRTDLDPDGTVSYALPQTSLTFDVEAVQEKFYAGPYARFAQKYLGAEVRQQDECTYKLSGVKVTPCIEADQSRRYVVTLSSKNASANAYLQLTSQGLVAASDGSFGNESVWRFPVQTSGDFSDKGVISNYTSESATLYQNVRQEDAISRISVQQDMVVEKSLEKKAQEAADMIFSLRKTRVQIVTGDTDANYSGAAMESALNEISRLEKEYLTLFIGYSEFQTQNKRFDVVPANDGNNIMVVFRLSDTDGLLPADNMSGKPYFVDIVPQEIASTADGKAKGSNGIMYRIPAICNVKLSDGVNVLLQSRLPLYQYGVTKSYPIK